MTPDTRDRNASLVDQYIHWTLVPLCRLTSPDAREVHITVDLVHGHTRTAAIDKQKPDGYADAGRLDTALDVLFTVLTGPPSKFDKRKCVEFIRNTLNAYRGGPMPLGKKQVAPPELQ